MFVNCVYIKNTPHNLSNILLKLYELNAKKTQFTLVNNYI